MAIRSSEDNRKRRSEWTTENWRERIRDTPRPPRSETVTPRDSLYSVKSREEHEAQQKRMDEFLKETRDAQFNARMHRYERDKARKEAEFRHQQQTEVIGTAL